MGDKEFIHICMGLHDPKGTYSVNVLIVIYSVIHNTSDKVKFHIFIDDSVSDDNKEKMQALIAGTHHELEFCIVNMEDYNISGDFIEVYTVGALMRLLIPSVLNTLDKVIYMDADLLVNRDVSELWSIDVTGVALAGVRDKAASATGTGRTVIEPGLVKAEEYINSGVLLMNLTKIREMGVMVELVADFLSNYSQSYWPDQDALNYVYRDSKRIVEDYWNILTILERESNLEMHSGIYHFAGHHYLWTNAIAEYDMKLLYTKMLVTKDFGIADELRRVINSQDGHVKLTQKLVNKLSRKNVKCIFYGGYYGSLKTMIEMVGTKYGDYFVLDDDMHADSPIDGIPILSFNELRNEIRGAFVVFVLPEADSSCAISKLEGIGLIRDEDYFVAPCVMTAAQGGYLY